MTSLESTEQVKLHRMLSNFTLKYAGTLKLQKLGNV